MKGNMRWTEKHGLYHSVDIVITQNMIFLDRDISVLLWNAMLEKERESQMIVP